MISLLTGMIYFGQRMDQDGVMNINGAIFIFLTNMTFQNVFAVINVGHNAALFKFIQSFKSLTKFHNVNFGKSCNIYIYIYEVYVVDIGILCGIADISSRASKWNVSHRCLLHLQDTSGGAYISSDTLHLHYRRLSHDWPLSRYKTFSHHC